MSFSLLFWFQRTPTWSDLNLPKQAQTLIYDAHGSWLNISKYLPFSIRKDKYSIGLVLARSRGPFGSWLYLILDSYLFPVLESQECLCAGLVPWIFYSPPPSSLKLAFLVGLCIWQGDFLLFPFKSIQFIELYYVVVLHCLFAHVWHWKIASKWLNQRPVWILKNLAALHPLIIESNYLQLVTAKN